MKKNRRHVLCSALAVAIGFGGAITSAHAQDADERKSFDVPAQSAASALNAFAEQADITLVFSQDLVAGITTRPLEGAYTTTSALQTLLEGTGLTIQRINENTISIGAEARHNAPELRSDKTAAELEKITVTGTRIRGAELASPLVMITQEEMRLSGHNNLGEVVRALPQNFSGGQNPGVLHGATLGGEGNFNTTGGSAINLRGLGADATLTLLNGTRLAYDGFRQAVDISAIPASAVERIEVLLDGASAIYGSDAIGGVANIILKRDYEGVEFSARHGAANDGGFDQRQYTALAGFGWNSGGVILTGDVSNNTQILARQRDYLPATMGRSTVYPEAKRRSALVSGYQMLGEFTELGFDAFYMVRSENRTTDATSLAPTVLEFQLDTTSWGVSPALNYALPRDWTLRLDGFIGRNRTDHAQFVFDDVGIPLAPFLARLDNKAETVGIGAEGQLFRLSGGNARLSVGGGWRKNTFDNVNLLTGTLREGGEDSSYYSYGEIHLPILPKLVLNGALRHESYDSFGSETVPKLGTLWKIVPGVDFRASWGQSFKVPTLSQQFSGTTIRLDNPAQVGYGNPPDSVGTVFLSLAGSNPHLEPERADVLTAGFVIRPGFMQGLTLELNWYDIDYEDRVATAITPLNQMFVNPNFSEFRVLDPSDAEIAAAFALAGLPAALPGSATSGSFSTAPANPDWLAAYNNGLVYAIVDRRNTNVARWKLRGADLLARYVTPAFGGDLTVTANGGWITDATRQITVGSDLLPAAGIAFYPAKFKGRIGANWSQHGKSLSLNVHHVGGVVDTTVVPNGKTDAMTTADLVLDYLWGSRLLGEVGLNVAVINMFNERPPLFSGLVAPYLANFDTTNYSVIGRMMSVTITKKF